jgi:hypothetical protein
LNSFSVWVSIYPSISDEKDILTFLPSDPMYHSYIYNLHEFDLGIAILG